MQPNRILTNKRTKKENQQIKDKQMENRTTKRLYHFTARRYREVRYMP